MTAFAVDSALQRLGTADLWPGFEPLSTPVAIFDGTVTTLFRHPSRPDGYQSLSSRRGVWARVGRDSVIVANSSATLGGVPTATVILNGKATRSAEEWAALTIHELFHVFQRAKHPDWIANEVDLFTYPIADTTALVLRMLEDQQLWEAMRATSLEDARCAAGSLWGARNWRARHVGAGASSYDRGTELNEGLAQYVELRALGRAVRPPGHTPAAQVRERAYKTGAAVGQLLDRLRPAWRAELEAAPANAASLDSLLSKAQRGGDALRTCPAIADESSGAFLGMAARDIDVLFAEQRRDRSDFLSQPGWLLLIESGKSPLFPQGFDPLNVRRVGGTGVLHTRFVKLGNAAGTVSTFDRSALTEGVGPHPLFNGVRVVTITGLDIPAAVRDSAGVLLVRATGVDVQFRGARADTAGQMIRIRLP